LQAFHLSTIESLRIVYKYARPHFHANRYCVSNETRSRRKYVRA
jgi:hypothetical protein